MSVSFPELSVVYFDIQPATERDIDAAKALLEETLLTDSGVYFGRDSKDIHALAAVGERGELFGISCLTYPEDEDAEPRLQNSRTAALELLAVQEPYQRAHGIGSALLKYSEYTASRGGLNTMFLKAWAPAQTFYELHGYAVDSSDAGHDDDLVPMKKHLGAVIRSPR